MATRSNPENRNLEIHFDDGAAIRPDVMDQLRRAVVEFGNDTEIGVVISRIAKGSSVKEMLPAEVEVMCAARYRAPLTAHLAATLHEYGLNNTDFEVVRMNYDRVG